jgi:hypothetical protein
MAEQEQRWCDNCTYEVEELTTSGALELCDTCHNAWELGQGQAPNVNSHNVVWQSAVTEDMTSDLGDGEVQSLIRALDDAVARVCSDYGVN